MTTKSAIKQSIKRMRRRVFEAFRSDRYSRVAQNDMERRLTKYIDFSNGVFVEAGANDGVTQSNTYWLEQFRGWRGVLVEPIPEVAAQCRKNRPNAAVVNAALVESEDISSITVSTGGLMAYVTGTLGDHEPTHRSQAISYQNLPGIREISVRARTLDSIWREHRLERVDLLSLDVEGYEPQVLRGLNLVSHRPRFVLAEGDRDKIGTALGDGYVFVEQISRNDVLFRATR